MSVASLCSCVLQYLLYLVGSCCLCGLGICTLSVVCSYCSGCTLSFVGVFVLFP